MLVPFLELQKKEEIDKKFRSSKDQLRLYENFRHLNLAELKGLLNVIAPQLNFKLPEQKRNEFHDEEEERSHFLLAERSRKQYLQSFAAPDDALLSEEERRQEEEVVAMKQMTMLDAIDVSDKHGKDEKRSLMKEDELSESKEFAKWHQSQEERLNKLTSHAHAAATTSQHPQQYKAASHQDGDVTSWEDDQESPDYEELRMLRNRRTPRRRNQKDFPRYSLKDQQKKRKEHFDDGELLFREPT